MSTQSRAILWIGLFLIAMQIVTGWGAIRQTLFTGSGGQNGSGNINPFNPGIGNLISPHPGGAACNPFEIFTCIPLLTTRRTPGHARAG